MLLICNLAVINRLGGVIEDLSRGSVCLDNASTPCEEPCIIVRTWCDTNFRAKYKISGNIEDLFTQFIDEGRATVCLKEPSYDIFMTKADPHELTEFIMCLKKQLPKDSPVYVSMSALEPLTCQIYLDGEEEYKSSMENVIRLNINSDHLTNLNISCCTLESAGYQVPIADAIRKMKNLTTLRLNKIKLRSSTFLEIESKELKRLYIWKCKTRLSIASLFKNDLCYKDSLVELRLDGNRWSEIPNGIFQFRNLLKLSLSDNRITHLPDKFTNLPKLQELDVSGNQLKRLPPSIFKIQHLLKLSLRFNPIKEYPNMSSNSSQLQVLLFTCVQLKRVPSSIFECRNLSELSLSINRITELPDMFANLSKLQELDLSHNQLRQLPPSIFTLQNLSKLSIERNFITELPDIINLPMLITLNFSNNRLRSVPSSIFSLQNLSELYLSSNFISELPNIINLPTSKLRSLWLCENQLGYVPSCIFALQNLSELELSHNHLTELPDKFTNLSKLKKLSLSSNQLMHLPPSIYALQNLSKLDLSGNIIMELPNMLVNLSKLKYLSLSCKQLTSVPSSIFALQNLSELDLSRNHLTELPDKFTNLSKLKKLSLLRNKLQYLPSSMFSLHLTELDIAKNDFNFGIPPSVGSELIVHLLKELSYRTILKHKLKVEEGMLIMELLTHLAKCHQCVCGCKFVDEGQDLLFFCNLNDILNFPCYSRHLRVPIRGKMCTSLKSCFLDRFTKRKSNH